MNDLYLIAHRVRSEPTFDIATRIECSACKQEDGDVPGCSECDDLGFWWVVPTSGHRAYPYQHWALSDLGEDNSWPGEPQFDSVLANLIPMPPNWPDHYTTRASPTRQSLASLLDIPRPQLKVDRRF